MELLHLSGYQKFDVHDISLKTNHQSSKLNQFLALIKLFLPWHSELNQMQGTFGGGILHGTFVLVWAERTRP